MTLTFGMSLYPFQRYKRPEAMVEVAVLAEDLGFETVTIGEHVIVPRESLDSLAATNFDSMVLGATLAARTTRLKVFFSILVVPTYHPVRLAKAIATLDFLSGGRVIVGVGAGWLEREFDILGVPFHERGARLDESLRAMKELWTSDDPSFAGRWTSFENVTFEPKPVQRPHPPLWIGGWSENAMRRAVAVGNGLYPSNAGPLDRMIRDKQRLTRMLADAGRGDDPFRFGHAIDYGARAGLPHLAKATSPAKDRVPLVFGYEPAPILEHAHAAAEAGFSHIGVRFPGDDEHEVMAAMKRFHGEVMQPFL